MSKENDDSSLDSVQKARKDAILIALRSLQIDTVTLEYYGSSDDGTFEDPAFYRKTEDGKSTYVNKAELSHAGVRYASSADDGNADLINVVEAVDRFLTDLFPDEHSGWENNDGGGGTFTIDVDEGTIELEHYDNIVERNYSSHEF